MSPTATQILHHVQGRFAILENQNLLAFYPEVQYSKTIDIKTNKPHNTLSQTPEHFLNAKVTATKSHHGLTNVGDTTSWWFQLMGFALPFQQAGSTCGQHNTATVQLWEWTNSRQPHSPTMESITSYPLLCRQEKFKLKNKQPPKKPKTNHTQNNETPLKRV